MFPRGIRYVLSFYNFLLYLLTMSDRVCYNCRKETQGKLQQCAECLKQYHLSCTKFHQITGNDGQLKICRVCITALNSPIVNTRSRTKSTSSTGSNASRPSTPPAPVTTDPALLTIIAKLDAMAKANSEKFASLDVKVTDCQVRLEEIPALVQRMEAVENRVTVIEEQLKTAGATPGGALDLPPAVASRVDSVETAVRELSDSMAALNAERAKLSSELLISGLHHNLTADLRVLALAVFRAVQPDFQDRDIISVRRLPLRATAGTSANGTAQGDEGASASAPPGRPPSLVVSLSTGSIAHSVIVAKARYRKLHSSKLSAELVTQAGGTLPLQPSLININEFLPADLHKLRSLVIEAARKKGFTTYIRGGEIFVKRKKEDDPTRISTPEQLKNFLEGSQ